MHPREVVPVQADMRALELADLHNILIERSLADESIAVEHPKLNLLRHYFCLR
jgi:hypothetical protein